MMKKVSVLCAMRDRHMAQSLCRALDDGERLSVAVVSSGDAAYAWACRLQPDILVLDAVLEGMDGMGVIDRLRGRLGDRTPRIIGGAVTPFSERGFRERGVQETVRVPWNYEELRAAIVTQAEASDSEIDWESAQAHCQHACELLAQIGMKESLKGFAYLAWAAALAHQNEARLYGVGERLYRPIADRFGTTAQNVERLIRHAVESTMDSAEARGIYSFFGNTIDPTRGKPTNAQVLGMLVQRMRVG